MDIGVYPVMRWRTASNWITLSLSDI